MGRLQQGLVAPGSATILQNFEASIDGGYSKIAGYQKYLDVAVPGTGLIHGVIALSGSEVLVERDGNYYYSDGLTWASKLALTTGGNIKIRGHTYNFTGTSKTVVVDGINPPAYFNYLAKTMAYGVGAPPEVVGADRVLEFKNHLFFSKDTYLSFTSPYLESDFNIGTGAGVINVGDEITGLVTFREQLIVFCVNSIYRLSGTTSSDFVLQPITHNTGCLSGDTIQEVGGDIMYLGPDGIRYLSATERNNDFGLNRASDKIQKQVTSIVSSSSLYSSITISSKNQYRLFHYVGNVGATNSRGFIAVKFSDQSTDDISWSTLKGFKVYSSDKLQAEDTEYLFFSSDTDYIYRMGVGNSFDGGDIEAIFETPYMAINDPKIRKTLYKHTLYAKPQGLFSLSCRVKFDYDNETSSQTPVFAIGDSVGAAAYGSPDSLYGTAVYGETASEQYFNNVVGSGFVVAIRYSDTSKIPLYNINFLVLEYRTNERR